jgi:predicted peptidase
MAFTRFLFWILCFTAIATHAQVQTAKYNQSIASNSNGFYEYLPEGYATGTQKYPLIIFIHGNGQRGNGDSLQLPRILQGLAKVIQDGKFPKSFTVNGATHRFIVLSPQFIVWPSPIQIEEVINYAVSHYRVNRSRIYLTGYSMGGGVVWDYVGDNSSYANRIAAIFPVAGSSFASPERGRVIAAANIPVWATHNHGQRPMIRFLKKMV